MTSIGLTTASHSRQSHDISKFGVQPRQRRLASPLIPLSYRRP